MKNFLHHLEYEKSGLKIEDISKLIKRKKFYTITKLIRERKVGAKLIN